MVEDVFPAAELHNVAELTRPTWTDGGWQIHRAPESVRQNVNVEARGRLSHPTGSELRVTPAEDEIAVTLSAAERVHVQIFWGPFQVQDETGPVEIGPTPARIQRTIPEEIRQLDPKYAESYAIDPEVCRIRFESAVPVAIHDIDVGCLPPVQDELPDRTYLAYGTSITEGAAASGIHLSYVAQVADHLGVDPINLGTSGSAFCEPAIADYIAEREWDMATLAVSVNMANRGFTVEQFRERARSLIHTVADAHPDDPVICVTLFPFHADLHIEGDVERATAFRDAVRGAVEDGPRNLHLIEGGELLHPRGLTTDHLHPGDAGMIQIGHRLAAEIDRRGIESRRGPKSSYPAKPTIEQ